MHLAAQNGHLPVLEVLRSTQSLRLSSKKLGLTALHVAAFYGQTGTDYFERKALKNENYLQLF